MQTMDDAQQSAEQLFEELLDLPPHSRSTFLNEACRDLPELRRQVEALLLADQQMGSFLGKPLLDQTHVSASTATAFAVASSRFQPEDLIAGRFLVTRFIARGGMGEVYEARDQLLQGESIALKIIRPEIAANATASSRFEQEVILARKVVHPNLCPIYEIFRCEQPAPPFLFLTMRLLAGETLEARLKTSREDSKKDSRKLRESEVREISRQLLDGVAALHAAGIIHRDLKPNNIMLEQHGQQLNISIMDFGLARLHEAESSVLGSGMIAGTPGYMAPELLRGERPTRATDLYALGVVLHQVLTGERPRESERGLSVTLSPALRSGHSPAALVEAVEAFLSPDPEQRDRAFARLHPAQPHSAQGFAPKGSPFRWLHKKTIWFGAGGLVAAALGIAILMTPANVSGPLESTQITFSSEPKQGPLFTDGARLYFESRGVPSEMAVSGGIIAPMPQAQPGMHLMDIAADAAKVLEWKPSVEDETRRGTLWVASSLGGTPRQLVQSLVNTPSWGAAAWSPDGESVFFTDHSMLYSVDADGGNLKAVWKAPLAVDGVCFSPDAKELTVSLWSNTQSSRLWRLEPNGQDARPLVPDWPAGAEQWSAQWTPDGRHFTFLSDREGRPNVYELVAPRWFEFWKKPVPVRITGNQVPILASAPARDSSRLFVLQRPEQGAMQALDARTGEMEPYLGGLAASEFVISPNRQWMVYRDFANGHLWRSRIDGSEPVQLTDQFAYMEQLSPDGKMLVYSAGESLFLLSPMGSVPERLISPSEPELHPGWYKVDPTWSGDGKSIEFGYYNFTDQPRDGIYSVDMATRKVSLMPNTAGFFSPSWSRDGKFMVAIAQNPSRMMLYTATTKAWTELTRFQVPWGKWTWAGDSKSVYIAQVQGQNGIYRLTVPGGKWEKLSDLNPTFRGLLNGDAKLPVSLTADGEPAVMSNTGVAQIYALHWKR
jgi:serine/threonine protein kinase